MTRAVAIAAAVLATGCIGRHLVNHHDSMPLGTCAATLRDRVASATAGDDARCEVDADDIAGGAVVHGAVHGNTDLGGTALAEFVDWADLEVDERTVRRAKDPNGYRSAAAGVGLRIGVADFVPAIRRWVDLSGMAGVDLGAIDFGGDVKGRFSDYLGVAFDVWAPDIGAMRYSGPGAGGVPGLRVGVRWDGYVQGWSTTASWSVSLLWRWGKRHDVYAYQSWEWSHD